MKKNLLKSVFIIYFLTLSFFAPDASGQAGGVSVNNTNTPAHPSAMLDVSSTSAPYLGMLIPRMTTANRNSIVSPATGLLVFNTDCGINEYYTGTCWISIGQNLRTPDPITCSGTTDFCAFESRTFTIPAIVGATAHQWIVPAGATIISGQGTTSVTVVFGNNSGQVCVRAVNLCEASPNSCMDIHINPVPLAPGNITGPTTTMPGTTASYFIAAVAGSSLYNWTVPSGATINSGAGTTSITVNFSCNAISGNVSVTAQNNCGASTASSLAITIAPVSANAGATATSPGVLGGSPTASGGTSPYTYAWAPSTNLNSTTIANPTTTVCTTTTYTVTVTDANNCTSSSSVIASVTNPVPATPGPISGLTSVQCNALSGNTYSISPVFGATTYTWTVPSGGSITAGQGTTSITANLSANAGDITVTAGNSCGTSSASTLAITITGGGATGSQTFNATATSSRFGSIQTFTVPSCVTSLTIEAWGSQGGAGYNSSNPGGKGARMRGSFTVTPGQVLNVVVGQMGASGFGNCNTGGGGGGGTFVYTGAIGGTGLLIAAGGGGGGAGTCQYNGSRIDGTTNQNGQQGGNGSADGDLSRCALGGVNGNGGNAATSGSYEGGGGTGWYSDGQSGPSHPGNGGARWNGGYYVGAFGGYGGGAGTGDTRTDYSHGAGGGGGYSGGGGTYYDTGNGGGGGSYNGGANQSNGSGVNTGAGKATITW